MNILLLILTIICTQHIQLSAAATPHNTQLTNLMEAIEKGSTNAMVLLLEIPVENLNLKNAEGITAIHKAAEKGFTEIVQHLISKNAIIYVIDDFNRNPLHYASFNGRQNIVSQLLHRAKAEGKGQLQQYIDAKNIEGETPLILALSTNRNHSPEQNQKKKQIVIILVTNGASLAVCSKGNYSPCHVAAIHGHTSAVAFFIEKKLLIETVINAQDENGQTPLHWAVLTGNVELAKILIEAGARVNAKDNQGFLPADYAMFKKNAEMTQHLLSTTEKS